MKIRSRLIVSILPPIIVLFIVSGLATLIVTQSGINKLEKDALQFKAQQLEGYIINQWNLLVEFKLFLKEDLVRTAQITIEGFAQSILKDTETSSLDRLGDTVDGEQQQAQTSPEIIFALINSEESAARGTISISTDPNLIIDPETAETLLTQGANKNGQVAFDFMEINGVKRAYTSFRFEPFAWTVFIAESVESFNRTNQIIQFVALIITVLAILLLTLILFALANSLTNPLRTMTNAAKMVIQEVPEINQRLPYLHNDETGTLSLTFNTMFQALDDNYQQLKKYAFNSAVAQRREARIRNIFQKYVPQELIDRFTTRPDSLLLGETREIAVLFCDIRGFSTISENMEPDELVKMLNGLFTLIVDEIFNFGGIVDKYIGDSIMAIFGAPINLENNALMAAKASLAMQVAVEKFNTQQKKQNKQAIKLGVGIHFGNATVGNIGSDKKIEYTAIGDSVNLASRTEGLCKQYTQDIIVTHEVAKNLDKSFNIRYIDNVAVKGKTVGSKIYTVLPKQSTNNQQAITLYHAAIKSFYKQNFDEALKTLTKASALLKDDFLISLYIDRCKQFIKKPPPKDWNGIVALQSK